MFKLPSTKEIIDSTIETIKRFPLAIVLMTSLVFYSIVLIHNEVNWNAPEFLLVIHVLIIGSIWAIGLTVFNEINLKKSIFKWISNIILILILIGYFFLFNDFESDKIIYRILIITIISVFVVLFLPYLSKNKQNDYWDYNRKIFQRLTLTTVYSVILYIGLIIALTIVNLLFELKIEYLYFDIWIVIVGIFAFLMFLNGFPKEYYSENEKKYDYPKPLKIFVQFILLPLVTLYLLILYAYFAKSIFLWELPEGTVSYLVLLFSALGIFSLIIIFPIQNDDNNKWIKNFSKGFYWALFPLIILLFVAILTRVLEYGITENRFYVLIMAIWLAAIATYMLITKQKNIKIITISFSILFFVSSFGPLSAFNVSKISQLNRLDKILIENNIIVDGKINSKTIDIKDSTFYQIEDISKYIINNHGKRTLEDRYNLKLNSVDDFRYMSDNVFADTLNVNIIYSDTTYYSNYFYFTYTPDFIDVSDYNYYYLFENYDRYDSFDVVFNDSIIFNFNEEESELIIEVDNQQHIINLQDLFTSLSNKHSNDSNLDKNDATFNFSINNYEIQMIINNFNGNNFENDFEITWFKAVFLIK